MPPSSRTRFLPEAGCAVELVRRSQAHAGLPLQQIRDNCIQHLQTAKQQADSKPFFVGCGLHKPHVRGVRRQRARLRYAA